ncbi:MAG TPA: GNAT family N-acetyltransferase [Burkholderiaceae bacterium]|nr:GNAT family N-acetyltransferase [Burkholderiaceae bacterium]
MHAAGSDNYCTRVVRDLGEVDANAWDALVSASPAPTPFVRHAFLHALHETGCASERSGWEPHFLTLWQGGQLCAGVPLYRKHHSYGEYVFDWAWADAHARHGLEYYPKWLVAVPFTPVPGTRIVAADAAAHRRAAQALVEMAARSGLTSLHVLFETEADANELQELGALTRQAVQFHWFNRGYADFDDYLAQLAQPKRKKVRAERRKVAEAGVALRRLTGPQITERDWTHFYRCYRNTYAAHHSTPYLNPRFFQRLAHSMPGQVLLVVASRGGRDIAAALSIVDEQRVYGRYWGALESVPCLHFEASYYQLIEFAIERGLRVIEGGAQGEHKHARGFEPVRTWSSHILRHRLFADAVERYLARETGGIEAYIDELNERSALRRPHVAD